MFKTAAQLVELHPHKQSGKLTAVPAICFSGRCISVGKVVARDWMVRGSAGLAQLHVMKVKGVKVQMIAQS